MGTRWNRVPMTEGLNQLQPGEAREVPEGPVPPSSRRVASLSQDGIRLQNLASLWVGSKDATASALPAALTGYSGIRLAASAAKGSSRWPRRSRMRAAWAIMAALSPE